MRRGEAHTQKGSARALHQNSPRNRSSFCGSIIRSCSGLFDILSSAVEQLISVAMAHCSRYSSPWPTSHSTSSSSSRYCCCCCCFFSRYLSLFLAPEQLTRLARALQVARAWQRARSFLPSLLLILSFLSTGSFSARQRPRATVYDINVCAVVYYTLKKLSKSESDYNDMLSSSSLRSSSMLSSLLYLYAAVVPHQHHTLQELLLWHATRTLWSRNISDRI